MRRCSCFHIIKIIFFVSVTVHVLIIVIREHVFIFGVKVHCFKGSFKFSSLLGETIQQLKYAGDDLSKPIKPDELYSVAVSTDCNPYMQNDTKMKNTSLENMKVEWIPDTILFSDGTKIALAETD